MGARRCLVALKQEKIALPLFEAELNLTKSPKRRASLLMKKGAIFEHALSLSAEAQNAYAAAAELDGQDVMVLRALERCERQTESWNRLSKTKDRLANAIDSDATYQAALFSSRARVRGNALCCFALV